ncbi:uncharacterized protein LOC141655443 [Silene latifolia]|uniref:uncharacterized protein LOC141655443 n=1 Tax=Silene latifolia TaxID=37657 RepID=UPI003D7862C8
MKRELQPAYNQNIWTIAPDNEYTLKKGYLWLRPRRQEVNWHHIVWTKWSIPKHNFISWLYYQQGFNTKDKLHRLGISLESSCCICAQEEESTHHLFFKCEYSRRVIQKIQEWTGVQMSADNTQNWWQHMRFTRLKNGILNNILNATMYYIWKQRNESSQVAESELEILFVKTCIWFFEL